MFTIVRRVNGVLGGVVSGVVAVHFAEKVVDRLSAGKWDNLEPYGGYGNSNIHDGICTDQVVDTFPHSKQSKQMM